MSISQLSKSRLSRSGALNLNREDPTISRVINLVIVHHQRLLLDGLRAMVQDIADINFVETTTDNRHAIRIIDMERIDVIVLDNEMNTKERILLYQRVKDCRIRS